MMGKRVVVACHTHKSSCRISARIQVNTVELSISHAAHQWLVASTGSPQFRVQAMSFAAAAIFRFPLLVHHFVLKSF